MYLQKKQQQIQQQYLINNLINIDQNTIINPYDLLKKMNTIIQKQKSYLDSYDHLFHLYNQSKSHLTNQNQLIQNINQQLIQKIQYMKSHHYYHNLSHHQNQNHLTKINQINLNKNKIISPTSKKLQYSSTRPYQKIQHTKSAVFDHHSNNPTKRPQDTLIQPQSEYIPPPIRLSIKNKHQTSILSALNNTAIQNLPKKQHEYAQYLLQTFLILGPDITQFKSKRLSQKNKIQHTINPIQLYCTNKYYKEKKIQFLIEMAKRAFPSGCKLKKKLLLNNQILYNLIEYKSTQSLNQDYFIFTIKGDEQLFKQTISNPLLKKTYLYTSNPNYFLYIVCLKIPDFIYVRDQKNYHQKQHQIWLTQKIYALATYFPFFTTHLKILHQIHSILSDTMLYKVMIDNENILTWNLVKNVYEFQKNEQLTDIISYFSNKKPDYSQVCYHNSYYFGTLPEFGYRSLYSMALFCCPVFFSNFSYEELLLMLTAIFCQKTLIFLSKIETLATLSALFLINLISPFQYSQPLLLNCDSQRVKQMIFEFPFAMICSIKKIDDNIEQILQLFAESNIMRSKEDDAQYILIDVDSNSILYHNILDKLFQQCIVSPREEIKQAYLKVNSCESKSFSLPKAIPRQNFKPNTKPKSEQEKRKEEIKKQVKLYQQKMQTNQTKLPIYRINQNHESLLKLLTEYIQQFTLTEQNDYEILNYLQSINKYSRVDKIKSYLLEKFKNRSLIINKFLQSQMYANYLDSILQ